MNSHQRFFMILDNKGINMSRQPYADATATLGTIHTKDEGRDAIHLGVYQVELGAAAQRGAYLSVQDGKAFPVLKKEKAVGILDPFLHNDADMGDKVWLVLFPGMITSLRHVWEHPAFPNLPQEYKFGEDTTPTKKSRSSKKKATEVVKDEPIKTSFNEAEQKELEEKSNAREVIERYAASIDLDYDEMMEKADEHLDTGRYYVGGSECEGTYFHEDFWDAYEIITGKTVESKENFISCSC